jgi:hypothetical protein
MVATRFRMDLWQVADLMRYFREVDGEKGAVTRAQFRRVLEQFLDSGVPDDLLDSAWGAVGGTQATLESKAGEPMIMWESKINALCEWYITNLFGPVALACQSHSDELVMSLVQEWSISPVTAEKLKTTFDSFDLDGSGVIDYNEFRDMLAILLNVSNDSDLSRDRVYRFWKEVDRDSSGEVDFLEFGAWYLKYFSPEADATKSSIDARGLLGKFYSTYDPRAQRASMVSATNDELLSLLRTMGKPVHS